MTRHVIRVVGPPGSGKSLFITSLQQALRTLGVRSAAVVPIGDPASGTAAISVAISTGSRSTIDREVPLGYLTTVVGWIDPGVEVVLAEDYVEPGAPALEVRPADAAPFDIADAERFAVINPEEIAERFAADGPGYTAGVAERIVRELLGREPAPLLDAEPTDEPSHGETSGNPLGRFLRRFRG
ncbi:MAG: hypothetical protein DWG77_00050 [Chloroflexi bacterium]|nr:hypothetical protein [Chloroflexota bacterium]MQC47461.1 hypothetical protein [Chloroflexota bacterium]